MKIIQGDLIEMIKNKEIDIAIHGCNCFCAMEGGIAAQMVKNFPVVKEADDNTQKIPPQNKLGNYSSLKLKNNVIIVNGYTQFHSGPDVDYKAIRSVFKKLHHALYENDLIDAKIAFPKIGAGIAGGDWDIISKIIEEELKYCTNLILVEYKIKKI